MARDINCIKVAFADNKRTNKRLAEQAGKVTENVSKWDDSTLQAHLETPVKIAGHLVVDVRSIAVG